MSVTDGRIKENDKGGHWIVSKQMTRGGLDRIIMWYYGEWDKQERFRNHVVKGCRERGIGASLCCVVTL